MSITKWARPLNYGRGGHSLYLLVEEPAPEGGELLGIGAAHEGSRTLIIGVARATEYVPAGEDASYLKGGLSGGGDHTHLRTEDAVDRRRDERIVGATEHDRPDPALHQGLQIAPCDPLQGRSVHLAAFDHGHELWTRLLVNLDASIERVNRAPVRPTRRRKWRRKHTDTPVTCLFDRSPGSRFYNAEDRHLESALRRPQRGRRCCVAGDHDQLHVHSDEVVDDPEPRRAPAPCPQNKRCARKADGPGSPPAPSARRHQNRKPQLAVDHSRKRIISV